MWFVRFPGYRTSRSPVGEQTMQTFANLADVLRMFSIEQCPTLSFGYPAARTAAIS
jgi:hypothetical protein